MTITWEAPEWMATARRLFIFMVLVTCIFARMDWNPIHQSYVQYGKFPNEDVYRWWQSWSETKDIVGKVVCPPCKMLAEPYYFVFFEIEASTYEQQDLLTKHAPYDGIFAKGFYWGQGGEDNSNPWRYVSWTAWFLYWLPYTIIWWLVVGDLFSLRTPWWITKIKNVFRKKNPAPKTEPIEWKALKSGSRGSGKYVEEK